MQYRQGVIWGMLGAGQEVSVYRLHDVLSLSVVLLILEF
jgi:hypothetical protein